MKRDKLTAAVLTMRATVASMPPYIRVYSGFGDSPNTAKIEYFADMVEFNTVWLGALDALVADLAADDGDTVAPFTSADPRSTKIVDPSVDPTIGPDEGRCGYIFHLTGGDVAQCQLEKGHGSNHQGSVDVAWFDDNPEGDIKTPPTPPPREANDG